MDRSRFLRYNLDDPIQYIKNDAINSAVEAFTSPIQRKSGRSERSGRVRVGIGGMGAIYRFADQRRPPDQFPESWVNQTDIDGFNLAYAVTPETFSIFVEFVVPELQRRGVYKTRVSRRDSAQEALWARPRQS